MFLQEEIFLPVKQKNTERKIAPQSFLVHSEETKDKKTANAKTK